MVTWGNDRFGADSSRVQDQLHDVQELHGTKICSLSCGAMVPSFAGVMSSGTNSIMTTSWKKSDNICQSFNASQTDGTQWL